MSKKSKDNILVDMYNLKLTENPDKTDGINPNSQDEGAILIFLKEYDPNLAKYVTDYVFDWTNPTIDGYEKRTFEQIRGKPYFQSYDVIDFYKLYDLVKDSIDSYINRIKTPTSKLELVIGLLDDIKHSLLLTGRDGKKIIVRENDYYNKSIPKEIDLPEYTTTLFFDDFGEYIFGGTGIYLTLNKLKYRLFNAILSMWNGEITIKKCLAEQCNKLFVAYRSGRLKQIYCSKACKMQEFRKRKYLLPIN